MKDMELHINSLVEITWEDSSVVHGWTDVHGSAALTITVGYLLKENEREIILGSSLGMHTHLCATAIPKICITNSVVLDSKLYLDFIREREQRINND